MSAAGRLRSHPFGPSTVVTLVGACLLAAILSACGGSDATAPTEADRAIRSSTTADPAPTRSTGSTTSTTISPPATTPIKGEEDEVKAAYLRAYAAYFEVAKSPNPDDERLAMTRSGPSLARVRDLLRGFQESKVHVKYPDGNPPIPTVREVDVNNDVGTVRACLVDDGVQVRDSDGDVVDGTPVSRLSEAQLRRSSDSWRIYTERGLQQWLDNEGCDR